MVVSFISFGTYEIFDIYYRLEMDLIDVDENNAMKITMLDTNHLDFEVLSSVKFDDVEENK